MDKGLINIVAALSMNELNKCLTCWCSKECDEVGGETLCGVLRTYYLQNKIVNTKNYDYR